MSKKFRTKLLDLNEYVALDIETTGLDMSQCEVIEVSGVHVVNGRETSTFQELVKPEVLPIPRFIEGLTGIKSEVLATARSIDDVLPDFLAFVGDCPIVGQNITFDMRFLDLYTQRLGLGSFMPIACDTMRFSRILYPEMESHGMYDVIQKCKEISGEQPCFDRSHRALADSRMASWCYEVMRPILTERYGSDPEREVLRLRRKSQQHESFKETLSNISPTVAEIDEDNPFFGSNICFTGKLSCMTRKEAMQHAVNLGATPQQSVTKKTDFLIVGSLDFSSNIKGDKSKKLEKAEALLKKNGKPEIASEEFFTQFCD
jgi:DNA polymerase-3 subunit epsilon